ncbi:sugar transporter [Phlyctema vagabunda]|uniref:Sugar transporter n=1 Tax=Phlyctema vagabunda TaxID=108571 RepID=A0ABR4P6I2_9HELO
MTAGYNTLYYIGSLISAWATFGTRNYDNSWAWRIPSILQLLIPAIILPAFIVCPESPRWLISQGRNDEARAVFVRYHAGGDASSALVAFEMAEVEQALEMEAMNHKNASYADMFKTKGNRHRLLISVTLGVFAQWNGVGVVSYYLAAVLRTVGITSVTQQTLINGFLQLWNLIIAVGAAGLVDRVGRRPLLILSSFGMLICYIIITGLSGSFANTQQKATGLAVIPMLFIYYGFYDIAYTPLVISYPAEIWQYQLRARGIAVTISTTYLALFFNLLVNPIALNAIAWKYYIVYIAILVGICFTAWTLYPETRGRTLEEIAVIFDGEDAQVPAQGVVLRAVEEKMDDAAFDHMEHTQSKV